MKAGELLAILFFILLPFLSFSQPAGGSFGDPVVNIDFGSAATGPNFTASTGYQRIYTDCPNDGNYIIATRSPNCFSSAWHILPEDHTPGDTNGYMMVVNSDPVAGKDFYRQTVTGLCPNTTYEFAAWIININKKDNLYPNVTFTIETPNGTVLKNINTGDIEKTATPEWKKYSVTFTTQPGQPDIVLAIKNNAPGGSIPGNDLALDDITFRPAGPTLNPVITGTGSNSTHLCEGDTRSLEFTTADVSTFYTSPRYQWQQSDDGINWMDIPGNSATHPAYTASFVNVPAGAYYYRMLVAETANFNSPSCRVASDPISVTVDPPPVIAAETLPVCEGSTLQLNLEATGFFKWTGPNGWTSTEQKPAIPHIQLNQAGTYSVTINNGLCTYNRTTKVTVNPLPHADAGQDIMLCEGESTTLNASGGIMYQWSPATGLSDPNTQNPVAKPLTTTTYTVLVTSASGCQASAKVTLKVSPKIEVNAGDDQITVQKHPVYLKGTVNRNSDYYIVWEPSDFLDNPHSLTPIATPLHDITYTLKAFTSDGCPMNEDQVFIRVYQSLEIPNTFSPNGDGINDTWNIAALNTYPHSVLTVYNRYGNVAFRSVGYPDAWDGKNGGKDLPAGIYYYTIDLKERNEKTISGWVVILR
ncbi:gliding motility-associated C-terminal domain-containing protein [Pedobacter sp. BS3]|uniref:gliding motility-associated C-terminal domain-containing protein n=1 Tax=Pedobacter sp. BS3 TaxID=2567937 RepID=UPI0011F05EF3|nr:gliding motility-associated C-terminal domain-containing protein [Pedobacter sp. BS3]TZF81728.1 gliding motility-associated C-terminal domain-containing protein [Pedobacter sp. BS3]